MGDGSGTPKVAYVLKTYPRYSQTFILNEILAHQNANEPVEIFSLRRPKEGRYHEAVTRIRSEVMYFDEPTKRSSSLWSQMHAGADQLPNLWTMLQPLASEDASDVEQAIAVACQVKSKGIEHLHAHFGNIATSVARMAAKMAGITYSFTAHAKDIFHITVNHDELRRKLADAAFVVTVSEFNTNFLENTFGDAARGVVRVYNGLDLEAWKFQPKVATVEPTIIAVGRLVEKKGFGDLIDACAILRDQGQSFRCEIIGDGPLADELSAQIRRHRLESLVQLTGAATSEEVAPKISAASLLVAPCIIAEDGDRDGLPTVLLEAMAVGTPCISTAVTGIPEAIRDNETGFIVPQNSAASIADMCKRLLGDRQRCQQIAANARRHIQQHFDVQENASRLRELFFQTKAKSPVCGVSE